MSDLRYDLRGEVDKIAALPKMNRKECGVLLDACQTIAYIEDIPLDRLAEICQAEREGRNVVMPCKVGDTVFKLWSCGNSGKSIADFVVSHIDIDFLPEIEIAFHKRAGVGNYYFAKLNDFGKTTFLTREAAEAALNEVKH